MSKWRIIYGLGVLFFLALSGCGRIWITGSEDPSTMPIPATSDYPSEEASSAAEETSSSVPILKDLIYSGTVKSLSLPASYDLDGDGEMESISFKCADNRKSCILRIEEVAIQLDYCHNLSKELFAFSLDGKTIQLLVLDCGFMGTPAVTYVYTYEKDQIFRAGKLPGEPDTMEVYPEENYVTASGPSEIFQSFSIRRDYTIEKNVLVEIQREFYAMGNTVTVQKSLTLYETEEGLVEGITLQMGSEVIILGTDNVRWVCIRDLNGGEEGWLQVSQNDKTKILVNGVARKASEYFSGLRGFDSETE